MTTSNGALRDDSYMQNAVEVLPLVLYGTTAVYVISGVLAMFTRPNLYDQVGQGELSGSAEDSLPEGGLPDRSPLLAAARAELEEEARQILQARSERLVRQGQPPLDIDAELAKLDRLVTTQAQLRDEEVLDEIRQLTILRNERRVSQGLEALCVEAEIERALAEFDLLGHPTAAMAYAGEAHPAEPSHR